MYSVGNKLKINLFGRSHGECVGCIIEGLPIGMRIDSEEISRKMSLRKPSRGLGTGRTESDEVVFEYGVKDDSIVSNSVMIKIMNGNCDSSSYSDFINKPRPGHADLPAMFRFKDYDISGGGQFSGRMTAPIVAAGSIAEQYLESKGIRIAAYSKRIGNVIDDQEHTLDEIKGSESFATRAVSAQLNEIMSESILKASEQGDSVGGIVGCCVTGLPIGFGGTWFDGLDVTVARMMFSIPGVKGVEFGKGFELSGMMGSESNDQYCVEDGRISALSNNMGGVCGGMSNGMSLVFDVAFKPTPSIAKQQRTVNLNTMTDDIIEVKGRHDPCIVPRAVPVVEAMTALAIMDQKLCYNSNI